ncbi:MULTISPECIES: methionine ABC transporter ATP-binding protein [Enterococcus]|uniref:ABC transporter ATP-binding protein n=1 Tax=Enterococcus sulfureus ATCC 49903 TaxID=1140003 RepID=S0L4M3_9ENTE|nr:ATP-binding cassette domain-containing protein [Enterococcus sulfureus]EOT46451.1 ABC transporter ATP-binding protein [Enterococcus sulfureus ATCC 49903]EOT86236.1 ABC transporter ATP-binding protein [Enterococcus sulfureus ATCC 49903]
MIELKQVDVVFTQKKKTTIAVSNVNLSVEKKDIFGIVGYSGAGKSTLVRLINLLQRPTSGEVIIDGVDLTKISHRTLRQQRKQIGMIFQHFNLFNARTVFDNVAFALKYSGLKKAERTEKVTSLLQLVGLEDKAQAYPSQLSGGQKQRVAIARALASDPKILLCDEATSALDPKTTIQILELLQKLNRELDLTIVLITHEMQVVKEICNKVAVMEDGQIIEQGRALDIFSQPQKALTKDFIRTATHIDQALATILEHPQFSNLSPNEWLVELSYVGDETDQPLIAQLFSRFQVTTNILYGNVEIIQGTALGTLVVVLTGNHNQKQKVFDYLKKHRVNATLLKEAHSKHQNLTLVGGA